MKDFLTWLCIPVCSSLDACLLLLQNLGCVPANSWHKWLENTESQEGWSSVSVFLNPRGVSPQPRRMKHISAKNHQWASLRVLDRGRKEVPLAFLFICFPVSSYPNNEKRENNTPRLGFLKAQSSYNLKF